MLWHLPHLINGIKNELLEFDIPKNVTDTINLLLGYAQGALGQIDIGELNVFRNIGTITSTIKKALEIKSQSEIKQK